MNWPANDSQRTNNANWFSDRAQMCAHSQSLLVCLDVKSIRWVEWHAVHKYSIICCHIHLLHAIWQYFNFAVNTRKQNEFWSKLITNVWKSVWFSCSSLPARISQTDPLLFVRPIFRIRMGIDRILHWICSCNNCFFEIEIETTVFVW